MERAEQLVALDCFEIWKVGGKVRLVTPKVKVETMSKRDINRL